ncbi:MAG: hypothetical protein JNG84_01475 [Archangium sp.]|nr:hypothetical protein [Archangium sp.]
MSVRTSIRTSKRRSPFDLVVASLGVLLATGWFVASKRAHLETQRERVAKQLVVAEKTIEHHFSGEDQRLLSVARLLSGDQRLRQTVFDAIDEPTLVDSFKDLEPLDGLPIHAALTPEGTVAAVVGAPSLRGVDLSSSAVVRTALQSDTPGTSRWFIDGKLVEVGVAAIRRGTEVKALVLVGAPLSETALKEIATATGVTAALVSEGKVGMSSASTAAETTALAAIAAGAGVDGPPHKVIDVPNTVPATKIVLLREGADSSDEVWRWVPLGGALLFALLAVARAGR